MKKRIVVATRDPSRVNRLLSVLAEWLQINIIIKDFAADSQGAAQVVFCRTGDDPQFGFSATTDRLILFSGKADNNETSPSPGTSAAAASPTRSRRIAGGL